MRRFRLMVLAAATLLASVAGLPAHATLPTQTVTSVAFSYVSPVTVIAQGDSLTYANVDVAPHDIVSDDLGPDFLPLFASDLIRSGTSPVRRVETLQSGTYRYGCSLHPSMHGVLQVVAPPAP